MFIDLLKDLEIDFLEYFVEYKAGISKIDKKSMNTLNKKEKRAFSWAFIYLIFNSNYGKKTSMKEFATKNNFSEDGIDYLERFCRLTDGASLENYTLHQFLQIGNQHYFYKIYQPKYPNDKGFIKKWEDKLIETKVDIRKNSNVLNINVKDNKVIGLTVEINKKIEVIKAKKIILTVPPKPLYNILNESKGCENAFGDITKWKEDNSYFDYIPMTFHYKLKIKLPKIEGFPKTAWGIGFIILSNYMDFTSDDEPSKTVISITITFPERTNEDGKTVHDCSKIEIIEYVKKQLNMFPEPDSVIISPNVVRKGDKWVNLDTAFVVTTQTDFLNFSSHKFDNLFAVGIFNGNSNYNFTSIESAVQNAIYFAKNEIKNLKYEIPERKATDITELIYIILIFVVIIISLIILKITLYKNITKN
jgi:hypothetical protein